MRVENWDPSVLSGFKGIAYNDLLTASYAVKDRTVQRLRGQIKRNINRPIYKGGYVNGHYVLGAVNAGEPWTARNAGQLLKSTRVVQKTEDMGRQDGSMIADYTNIRVYCGNYFAYYADIFEFYTPFMRPAFNESMSEIKSICGVV